MLVLNKFYIINIYVWNSMINGQIAPMALVKVVTNV
jgi:hypothetical protein